MVIISLITSKHFLKCLKGKLLRRLKMMGTKAIYNRMLSKRFMYTLY